MTTTQRPIAESKNLSKRNLGRTGLRVTQLGFGSMGLRGPRTWGIREVNETHSATVLNAVLDLGINFIDTAPDYGDCERRIGDAISHRRTEFILASKCGCDPLQHEDHLEIRHTWTRDTIERNLEQSLKNLRTETIDVYQFHGGEFETLEKNGLLRLIESYKQAGTIRSIGISTKASLAESFLNCDLFDVIQLPYSILNPESDAAMRRAAVLGKGVIVRGGIAHGGPDAEIQRAEVNQAYAQAKLDDLLTTGMSRAELLLRGTLSHPACDTVIVGTASLDHLKANVEVAKLGPLPNALISEIESRVRSGGEV